MTRDLFSEKIILGAALCGDFPPDRLQPGDFSDPSFKRIVCALQAGPEIVPIFRALRDYPVMEDYRLCGSLLAELMVLHMGENEPPALLEVRLAKLRTMGERRRLLTMAEARVEELGVE